MGMTIDEAIETLLYTRSYGTADIAKRVAINTMRKYQKIQEILRWNNAPSPYYKPDGQLFREISEVVESEEIPDD